MIGVLARWWTVRVRLTALYGAVALGAGAAVLAITYVLLVQRLRTLPSDPPPASVQRLADGSSVVRSFTAEQLASFLVQDGQRRRMIESESLDALLTRGGLALALITCVALALGWWISGRVLRPLQRITATAQRVADTSLDERIAMTGPRDELRDLADTFDSMLQRLASSFESQRRFVANASHELRTPLAINRTLVEVAMQRPDAPPQLVKLGADLLAVNARHERLIAGLLTLARAQHGLSVSAPVDLAAVASQATQLCATDARTAGVTVRLDARPATVLGDGELLERMVQNLLQNAVRYNVAAGGWVCVSTEVGAQGATLTVDNTGPAVAAAEVPMLFEPFRRLTDRVGSVQGSGLGLSIVQSVAVAHRGEAQVHPRPDGGLTVRVTLPEATADRS